jgi:hypothetical protein
MYILLADDTEDGFHSDADWEPKLFEYQQKGANVLVSFIVVFNKTFIPVEAIHSSFLVLKIKGRVDEFYKIFHT